MPRPYETVLILDSALDESQVEEKIDRLKRALNEDGAEPASVSVTHWGRRKLAYPIGKNEQGTYVILRYETVPERLAELERIARLDEQILRQLTIVDPVEPAAADSRSGTGAASERENQEEE